MISLAQKRIVHQFARRAGVAETAYRATLRRCAGVGSCADPAMTQEGFERIMATLETLLASRSDPAPVSTYWRSRLPDHGRINTRQLHKVRDLWTALLTHLDSALRNEDYLQGVVHKAIGRRLPIDRLSMTEAGHVIDALRDRLAYAIRPKSEAHPL